MANYMVKSMVRYTRYISFWVCSRILTIICYDLNNRKYITWKEVHSYYWIIEPLSKVVAEHDKRLK